MLVAFFFCFSNLIFFIYSALMTKQNDLSRKRVRAVMAFDFDLLIEL